MPSGASSKFCATLIDRAKLGKPVVRLLQVVSDDLCKMRISRDARLKPLSEAFVEIRIVRLAQAALRDVSKQDVVEPVCGLARKVEAVGRTSPLTTSLRRRSARPSLRPKGVRSLECGEVEYLADDRGAFEHIALGFLQRVEPRVQHRLDRQRHRWVFASFTEPPSFGMLCQRTVALEHGNDLFDEERVSFARPSHIGEDVFLHFSTRRSRTRRSHASASSGRISMRLRSVSLHQPGWASSSLAARCIREASPRCGRAQRDPAGVRGGCPGPLEIINEQYER